LSVDNFWNKAREEMSILDNEVMTLTALNMWYQENFLQ
jgi:hypothetical protein